jgi:23S rRNA (uridine2552-2'-O)-methyltransferase
MRNKFTQVKNAKGRKKSSNAWLKRQINDPFVKQAKEQGFRSRAAFKIIEIDDKFKIFKKGKIVLDLGAAPGGWSQVAVSKVGRGRVVAVDILPMDKIDGVKFLQQDFLSEDAVENIINFINKNQSTELDIDDNQNRDYKQVFRKFDVIMSDMAENTCGDSKTDHLRIVGLLEEVLDFSQQVLALDGIFVAKIFQGGAGSDLVQKFKKYFTAVKHFKPNSSRKESAENYVIAIGFKG